MFKAVSDEAGGPGGWWRLWMRSCGIEKADASRRTRA
jgi:hypothetical protein